MACAIANAAIEKCYKTLYVRLPDLIQELEERKAMHLSKTVLYKKYARPTLLIIDECYCNQLQSLSAIVCLKSLKGEKD